MSHVVARIGKPHGIRGEVTVRLHTDDPRERFQPGAVFATEAPAGSGVPRRLTVATARDHNGTWLLGFDQVPDRTGAEGLRGTRLLLPDADDTVADAAEPVDASEEGWYPEELVGLRAERSDGTLVGTVSGLRVGAAQDLLEVALPGGATAYLPFVEAIVPVVDVAGGRVVVDPPEGLLELAES